jgi:hypothetical protein
MAFIRHEAYLQPGETFSPVISLDGGFGKDFAFRIYRRAWDDRRIQRLSCAALNPTGAPTSLFLHIDLPVFTLLDADGTASQEWLHDTVNLVVYDNGEWKNRRSLIEFLCSHYDVHDNGEAFAGPKPVDLVMPDGPVQLRTMEQQRVVTKATWNDFEFQLVFDLPEKRVEIREIDPMYRAAMLRYLTDVSNVVPREPDGSLLTPKQVIETTLQMLASRLASYAPVLSLSQRCVRLRAPDHGTEAVLRFRADRNNKAGVRVGADLEIAFTRLGRKRDAVLTAAVHSRAFAMTWNANPPFPYELSRYQQREIIVHNLARYVEQTILPQLETWVP